MNEQVDLTVLARMLAVYVAAQIRSPAAYDTATDVAKRADVLTAFIMTGKAPE